MDLGESRPPNSLPLFQINYQFLRECVESSPILPIDPTWLEEIKMKIDPKLRQGKEASIELVMEEVQELFKESMKKSLVQLMLKKPDVKGLEEDDLQPPLAEPVWVILKWFDYTLTLSDRIF